MPNLVPAPEAGGALARAIDMQSLFREAMSKGAEGVAMLERLVALNQQIEDREARSAFIGSMAAFKAACPPIVKQTPGQHGVSRHGTKTKGMYASLDYIAATIGPVLPRFGLSYRFDREFKDAKDWVVCIVSHSAGHSERSYYPAPPDTGPGRSAIQAIGSGNSYGQRYALLAAFGIVTADPDDDGEAAGMGEETPAEDRITEHEAANLRALAKEVGADRAGFLAYFKIGAVEELPKALLPKAIKMLEGKRRK